MIFRRLYVLQAFEKSASILAQGALSWDIMYLHRGVNWIQYWNPNPIKIQFFQGSKSESES